MKVLIFAKGNAYEKESAFALQENNIDYTFVTTYPKYFLKKLRYYCFFNYFDL